MKLLNRLFFLIFLFTLICQCKQEIVEPVVKKTISHACAQDVSFLDEEILSLNNPFNIGTLKDVQQPENRVCRLISFLLEEATIRLQSTKRDRINALKNLYENRANNIKAIKIDLSSDHREIFKMGLGESLTIDLWLTPTCQKCAKFFLKDFMLFYESLQKQQMPYEVKVRLFPYMVLSDTLAIEALKSPQVIADQDMSILLYHHMLKGHQVTVDQLKKWFEIVSNPSLEKNFKTNPMEIFRNVFELSEVKEKDLTQSKDLLTQVLSKVSKEERNSSSFLFVNGKRWVNFQQFKLNQAHLTDFMNSIDDYQSKEK